MVFYVFFFKQKTAYEMRISDWSSDVCSSDLRRLLRGAEGREMHQARGARLLRQARDQVGALVLHRVEALPAAFMENADEIDHGIRFADCGAHQRLVAHVGADRRDRADVAHRFQEQGPRRIADRSEEHTSELQSLMRISYAVFCLKKKTQEK